MSACVELGDEFGQERGGSAFTIWRLGRASQYLTLRFILRPLPISPPALTSFVLSPSHDISLLDRCLCTARFIFGCIRLTVDSFRRGRRTSPTSTLRTAPGILRLHNSRLRTLQQCRRMPSRSSTTSRSSSNRSSTSRRTPTQATQLLVLPMTFPSSRSKELSMSRRAISRSRAMAD